MDRYLGDGRSFVKIGAPHKYKVGDVVFFSTGNHTAAGEGMFIGRLKESSDVAVLVIANSFVETLETECASTGRGFRAEGESWRRAYLKQHPGALVA